MINEMMVEAAARQASWKKLVDEAAAKFKLDPDVVEEIMDIGRSF